MLYSNNLNDPEHDLKNCSTFLVHENKPRRVVVKTTLDILKEQREVLWERVPKKVAKEIMLIDKLISEVEGEEEVEIPSREKRDYEIQSSLGILAINPKNPRWESYYKDLVERVFDFIYRNPGSGLKDIGSEFKITAGVTSSIVRWLEYTDRVQATDPSRRKKPNVERKFEAVSYDTSPVEGEEIVKEKKSRKRSRGGIKKGHKFTETKRREDFLENVLLSYPDGITTSDLYEVVESNLGVGKKSMVETLKSLQRQGRIDTKEPIERLKTTTWLPKKRREVVLRPGEVPMEGRLKN